MPAHGFSNLQKITLPLDDRGHFYFDHRGQTYFVFKGQSSPPQGVKLQRLFQRYRDRIQKSDRASSTESNRQTEIIRQYIDSLLTVQKSELMAMIEKSQQVPMPVERKLSKWEQLKQEVGGISIGILVVIVVIAVIWLIKKIRNQK